MQYPQCIFKMARFKGTNKLGEIIDSQQIRGNVFHMLNQADTFLRKHLMISSFFDKNQFLRVDKPTLPILPVREALINAICHRDYSAHSGSMMLAVYDDRLEIWNNGKLPKQLQLEDLSHEHQSWPTNPLIASIFYSMGLIETCGRGTNKMIEVCLENGLPTPTFEEYSAGIAVTFKFTESIGLTSNIKKPKPDVIAKRRKDILTLLKSPHSAADIHIQLQNPPTLRTIKADLLWLQQEGEIQQIGKGRNTLWGLKS